MGDVTGDLTVMSATATANATTFSIIDEAKRFYDALIKSANNTEANIASLQIVGEYAEVPADVKAEMEAIRAIIAGIPALFCIVTVRGVFAHLA